MDDKRARRLFEMANVAWAATASITKLEELTMKEAFLLGWAGGYNIGERDGIAGNN